MFPGKLRNCKINRSVWDLVQNKNSYFFLKFFDLVLTGLLKNCGAASVGKLNA